MKIKWDFSQAISNYNKGLAAMEKLSGFDREAIIKGEVGSIIKTCASRTKLSTATHARDGGRIRALRGMGLTKGDITVNAGVRGRFGIVWKVNQHGKYYPVLFQDFTPITETNAKNFHFGATMLAKVTAVAKEAKEKMANAVKQARLSVGLARKSWIGIADSLGINLATVPGGGGISAGAIDKARKATAKGGADLNNSKSKVENSQFHYAITIINRLPFGRKLKMDVLLNTVLIGRTKYFITAVQKGYKGALADTARLLPGWISKVK